MSNTPRYLPKLILCLVGDAQFPERAKPILAAEQVEHEFQGPEPRMVEAFESSACRLWPSLAEADYQTISRHSSVLYALSPNYRPEQAAQISHSFLRLGQALLNAGGWAMKCESSGIAHSRDRWLRLADLANTGNTAATSDNADAQAEGRADFWMALFQAFVRLPIQDGDDFHSCGMHLLGQPDMIVSDALLQQVRNSSTTQVMEAVELFIQFALYLLAECPDNGFQSGHTFRMSEAAPRYRVVLENCTGYEEDDFMYNPYGRYRFREVVS